MKKVIFYTKEDCLLCDEAFMYLETLQHLHSFQLEVRNIYENDLWLEKYHLTIPVIEINHQQLLGNDMSLVNIEQFIISHM